MIQRFVLLFFFGLAVMYLSDSLRHDTDPIVRVDLGNTAVISCCVNTQHEQFDGFYKDSRDKIIEWTNPNKITIRAALEYHVPLGICFHLYVSNIQTSDLGSYSCKTKDGREVLFTVIGKATLEVLFPSQVLISGSDVSKIKIKIVSIILPRIIWSRLKNGTFTEIASIDEVKQEQITGVPRYAISKLDGSLSVHNVSIEDSGLYQVRMVDGGSENSKNIYIKIEESPVIDLKKLSYVAGDDENSHKLTIVASGNPPPEFACKGNKQGRLSPPFNVTFLNNEIHAYFVFVSLDDTYILCEVKNEHGKDLVRVELNSVVETLLPVTSIPSINKTSTLAVGVSVMSIVIVVFLVCTLYSVCKLVKKRRNAEIINITDDSKEAKLVFNDISKQSKDNKKKNKNHKKQIRNFKESSEKVDAISKMSKGKLKNKKQSSIESTGNLTKSNINGNCAKNEHEKLESQQWIKHLEASPTQELSSKLKQSNTQNNKNDDIHDGVSQAGRKENTELEAEGHDSKQRHRSRERKEIKTQSDKNEDKHDGLSATVAKQDTKLTGEGHDSKQRHRSRERKEIKPQSDKNEDKHDGLSATVAKQDTKLTGEGHDSKQRHKSRERKEIKPQSDKNEDKHDGLSATVTKQDTKLTTEGHDSKQRHRSRERKEIKSQSDKNEDKHDGLSATVAKQDTKLTAEGHESKQRHRSRERKEIKPQSDKNEDKHDGLSATAAKQDTKLTTEGHDSKQRHRSRERKEIKPQSDKNEDKHDGLSATVAKQDTKLTAEGHESKQRHRSRERKET